MSKTIAQQVPDYQQWRTENYGNYLSPEQNLQAINHYLKVITYGKVTKKRDKKRYKALSRAKQIQRAISNSNSRTRTRRPGYNFPDTSRDE